MIGRNATVTIPFPCVIRNNHSAHSEAEDCAILHRPVGRNIGVLILEPSEFNRRSIALVDDVGIANQCNFASVYRSNYRLVADASILRTARNCAVRRCGRSKFRPSKDGESREEGTAITLRGLQLRGAAFQRARPFRRGALRVHL